MSLVALADFSDPVPLVRRQQRAPARPGAYVISCGDCIPHIGTSKSIQGRIRTLATLGNHRGSAEVLCAAFCTGEPPMVRWIETDSDVEARVIERRLKADDEPPLPRARFAGCVNGAGVRAALIDAAGPTSWEAGYIEALFDVGEQLRRLLDPRFATAWERVGWPSGPWQPS
ncbi:MAG: hypothetical protein ACRDYW_10395 [Acidimicrobiales bacterium]